MMFDWLAPSLLVGGQLLIGLGVWLLDRRSLRSR